MRCGRFYFERQTAAPEGMTIRAAVWYSDHVRRPWSEDCRTVVRLMPTLILWHAHLGSSVGGLDASRPAD